MVVTLTALTYWTVDVVLTGPVGKWTLSGNALHLCAVTYPTGIYLMSEFNA